MLTLWIPKVVYDGDNNRQGPTTQNQIHLPSLRNLRSQPTIYQGPMQMMDIYAEACKRIARSFEQDAQVAELKKKAKRERDKKSSKTYHERHLEKSRAYARARYHLLHPNATHYSKYKDEK